MTLNRETTLSILSSARRICALPETFVGHVYGDNGEIIPAIARKCGDDMFEITEHGPNAGK